MAILSVKVTRNINVKRKVYFYPWYRVKKATTTIRNLNIITVGDEQSWIYDPVPCKRRHILNTITLAMDLTERDYAGICDFVRSLNGESVAVHCEEGISRSRVVANYIVRMFPEYTLESFLN